MRKLLVIGSDTNHTYNYIELIRDAFDEIELITDKKREGLPYAIHEVGFSLRSLSDLKDSPKKIAAITKRFQPDVIHIHQANSYAFYTLRGIRKLGIPVVLTAWGSDILLLPGKSFLLKQMVKYSLKHATVYTSDSTFMAEEMRRLVPSKKMDILIANFGISITPVEKPKEPVFYSNRLHKPLYRVDKIIAAFAKFLEHDRKENWKLVIAATGEETASLEKQCAAAGISDRVEFVGWLDKEQNANWYARARYFVSIPESDATAISLLEAMASGCIPVLSDLPANKEWIRNGENGIIVEDVDTDFLSSVFEVDAEKADRVNKELIAAHGTKEANRQKFLSLYEKLPKRK